MITLKLTADELLRLKDVWYRRQRTASFGGVKWGIDCSISDKLVIAVEDPPASPAPDRFYGVDTRRRCGRCLWVPEEDRFCTNPLCEPVI